MDIRRIKLMAVLTVVVGFVVGCQEDGVSTAEPESSVIEQVQQDFGNYQPLKSEVLVRESSSSLVKFIELKASFILNLRASIDLRLAIFLKKNGEADVYADWVFPEYIDGGGALRRTHNLVVHSRWELTAAGIVVGDKVMFITRAQDANGYTGVIYPRSFEPPLMFMGTTIPEECKSLEGLPLQFEIVSEEMPAEIVNLIF